MSTRTARIYSLAARADAALRKGVVAFGRDDYDGAEGIQTEHIGAMAGGFGGLAAGAMAPGEARRQMRRGTPSGARIPRGVAAASRLANRRYARSGLKGRGVTAGLLGVAGALGGYAIGNAANPNTYT